MAKLPAWQVAMLSSTAIDGLLPQLAPMSLADDSCVWGCRLEYAELLATHGTPSSSMLVTGNGLAFMAGRLSYTFG
jgi:hypothetical protein